MGNCFLYKRGFGGFGGGGGEDIPEIEKTASGKVILLADSAEKPLKGLRLFGKTTQSGTPTLDAPIPLVIAGDCGSIAVKIGTSESDANAQTLTVSTPNGLPGIHVSEGGNYTDENSWQWICDEVDFARGVYVQRVRTQTIDMKYADIRYVPAASSDTSYYYNLVNAIATGYDALGKDAMCVVLPCNTNGYRDQTKEAILVGVRYVSIRINANRVADTSADSLRAVLPEILNVQYILAKEYPIPLSEIDPDALAKYAELHTNYPSTTLYNDADSYMEVKYMAKGG